MVVSDPVVLGPVYKTSQKGESHSDESSFSSSSSSSGAAHEKDYSTSYSHFFGSLKKNTTHPLMSFLVTAKPSLRHFRGTVQPQMRAAAGHPKVLWGTLSQVGLQVNRQENMDMREVGVCLLFLSCSFIHSKQERRPIAVGQ